MHIFCENVTKRRGPVKSPYLSQQVERSTIGGQLANQHEIAFIDSALGHATGFGSQNEATRFHRFRQIVQVFFGL